MAIIKNEERRRGRLFNSSKKKMDLLDMKMDDIYRNTYSSRKDNEKNTNKIANDIYSTVDSILSKDGEIQDIPDMSALYTRLQQSNQNSTTTGDKDIENIMELFSNKDLINSISTSTDINQYLKSLDDQYDMICKYMPKLNVALDIKKDNVLCSDNFTKEFLTFNTITNGGDDSKKNLFNSRINELKKKYNINELFDQIYDDTARYGEYFLYCVPYKKAIERLLNNMSYNNMTNNSIKMESFDMTLVENGNLKEKKFNKGLEKIINEFKSRKINVSLSFKCGILEDTVKGYERANSILSESNNISLYESFNESSTTLDRIIPDKIDYNKDELDSADGLINTSSSNNKDSINDIPGCIVKKLEHYNVRPIYIEDMCVGYYYFEFSTIDQLSTNSIVNTSTYPAHKYADRPDDKENDNILRYLANKVSNILDTKFINANQDLANEIYLMLRYNDKFNIDNNTNIRVTFLPPSDVFHFYFKLDPLTKHGISDLRNSLIPAMFHCLLKLSTTVGQVTRGFDKRIYHVKQNVDTNVARTLMNVVNQVKKGNLGIRQMESMNSILNIAGRFNDYIVPIGPSGDSPINFEVLEGQRIETPQELLDGFEEEAISNVGVPIEFVNTAMQVDYAMRYTMSNTKFLRMIYKRQNICNDKYSMIFTRIYNYHYNEHENHIDVSLPTPTFLSTTNGAQLLNNNREYVQQLADMIYLEDSPEKAQFISLMLRDMVSGLVNLEKVDKNVELADIITASKSEESSEE